MEITDYFEEMKQVQSDILSYINNEENDNGNDDYYLTLIIKFDEQIKQNNRYFFVSILHLLLNISNNHHVSCSFYPKIEKIILYVLNIVRQNFSNFLSNYSIYNIFKSNKRILLFLIKRKILVVDKNIADNLKFGPFSKYFAKEINQFFNYESDQLPDDFEANRDTEYKDNYICQMIQNDSIDDFNIYFTKTALKLDMKIKPSIFETNSFLVDKNPTLIELATFFGSIQVFNYLKLNDINLEESLWMYAIHSNKPDIIHFLEQYEVLPKDKTYFNCFEEAIKCHHNNIARYIQDNLLNNVGDRFLDVTKLSLQYYNYEFVDESCFVKSIFYDFCKYDYYYLVDNYLKNMKIDVNAKNRISYLYIVMKFQFFFFANGVTIFNLQYSIKYCCSRNEY